MMTAKERLYLTKDAKALVREGDPKGASLYAAPGDEIPDSAVERFGLVDGTIKGGRKEQKGGSDKERKPGGDKGGQDGGSGGDQGNGGGAGQGAGAPPADDLSALKGVGAKTAASLAAAGFTTFAAIAAIDAASPPQVEGLPAVFKWADVVADAKAKAPAEGSQG